MDGYLQIITVALIQGITEFLPISSSGHLVLLPAITGWDDQGAVMDVAAHLGTLGAVALYVRRDIVMMLGGLVDVLARRKTMPAHLVVMVILASMPAIAAGVIIQLLDPAVLRLALTVALANIVFAFWLWRADKTATQYPLESAGYFDWQKLTLRHIVFIGCAQALALIPGTSRSGVTMTMARQLGWDRLSAARFSLILSLPVILGAASLKGLSLITSDIDIDLTALIGVIALSFIFALLAVRWMMGWLSRASFGIFVGYRLVLGFVLLGCIGFGII